MSFEDIGVLRRIPGITIIDVADEIQLREVLLNTVDYKGVVYIRFPRKEMPKVYSEDYKFNINKADVLKEGKDLTIFCSGLMVNPSLEASKILESKGINAEVISVPVIKPIDKETIINSLKKTNKAITVENHNVIGGLYSAVCEVSCENYPALIKNIGIKDHFGEVGTMKFLLEKYKMTCNDIVKECEKLVK